MKIIGAGFPRTGTFSTKHALEELGFDPCYHMEAVLKNPAHVSLWQAVMDGELSDWSAIYGDYQAGVDAPTCLYYEQLMVEYPDAKVILNVRDSEQWYDSVFHSTIPSPN